MSEAGYTPQLLEELIAERTPLYLPEAACPTHLELVSLNAISSRVRERQTMHRPVLEVADASATRRHGAKVVLGSTVTGLRPFNPLSNLRDVLGDNGIDLELHMQPSLNNGVLGVEFITLRDKSESADKPLFRIVRLPGAEVTKQAHLFIEKDITDDDHRIIMRELAAVRIVSRLWHEQTTNQQMGIVKLPAVTPGSPQS